MREERYMLHQRYKQCSPRLWTNFVESLREAPFAFWVLQALYPPRGGCPRRRGLSDTRCVEIFFQGIYTLLHVATMGTVFFFLNLFYK